MDRGLLYPGQIPLETDLLFAQKSSMIGLSKLAAAMLGTSTVVNGLSVVPNSPAALNVLVNPGEIYALANIDGTAYSSIAADTTHQILKQGISLDQVTLACAAPGTAGFSINYLIQATFSEVDNTPVALPYYNASNPSLAYSGPNNSGTAQNTRRAGTVVLSAKPGTAATTGTQTTPAPDAGYVGLAVVTVANGQSTITSGNITTYSTLATMPAGGLLVDGMQNSTPITANAGGTADAITAAYAPAIAALKSGMTLYVRAASANATATPTFTPASGVIAPKTIVKGNGQALVAGDIAGGGHWVEFQYDLTLDKWVLLNPASGIGSGTVVGSVRNLKMAVVAASSSATLTADEVVVETVLGGAPLRLANVNKTINLATTGAGGMDTGTAPVSGYVAIYAIYNPTTQTAALLGTNATSGVVSNVYGGANMPSGYTMSALVSVWPTNASSQFKVGNQLDRLITFALTSALSTGTSVGSYTSLSISGMVPPNAKTVNGSLQSANSISTSQSTSLYVASDTNGNGAVPCIFAGGTAGGGAVMCPYAGLPLLTAQTVYYTATATAGTPSYLIQVNGYTF